MRTRGQAGGWWAGEQACRRPSLHTPPPLALRGLTRGCSVEQQARGGIDGGRVCEADSLHGPYVRLHHACCSPKPLVPPGGVVLQPQVHAVEGLAQRLLDLLCQRDQRRVEEEALQRGQRQALGAAGEQGGPPRRRGLTCQSRQRSTAGASCAASSVAGAAGQPPTPHPTPKRPHLNTATLRKLFPESRLMHSGVAPLLRSCSSAAASAACRVRCTIVPRSLPAAKRTDGGCQGRRTN